MFRNDKPLRILFAFIIVVSLFTSQLVYADQVNNSADTGTKSEVKTVEVKRGEYTEKSSLKNMEIVPVRQDALNIRDEGAIFQGFLAQRGQLVKKDDPLVAYTLPGDTVALEEKKFSLEQNEKAFKDSTARKQADIAKSVSQLQKMDGSTTDAKILQLNIQKMQISLDQYIYRTQKSIDDQKTQLKDMEDSMGTQYLKAPYDCYIVDAQDRLQVGREFDFWGDLIVVADVKSVVLSAKAAGAKNLWYNLAVKVTPVSRGVEDTSKEFTGRVISTSSILNGRVSTEDIYVTFDGLQSMASPDLKANIEVDAVDVKDVLVIPLTAVKKEDTMSYVYILDAKGQVQKQYISGRSNGVDMWVYNGLTEGQQIVIE